MMASEVPMQSCMRTSSGTSSARNTSYSTGTIMAPPPMPNRPARMPTRMPAPAIQSASRTISPIGYPSNIFPRIVRQARLIYLRMILSENRFRLFGIMHGLGGDVRQILGRVQHQRQRISHDGGAGARFDRLGRQMTAEGARARHRMEQAEDMAGDRMQPHALGQFALDIGNESQRRLFPPRDPRRFAINYRIDAAKPPGLVLGGAAHHHAIHMHELRLRLLDAGD